MTLLPSGAAEKLPRHHAELEFVISLMVHNQVKHILLDYIAGSHGLKVSLDNLWVVGVKEQ